MLIVLQIMFGSASQLLSHMFVLQNDCSCASNSKFSNFCKNEVKQSFAISSFTKFLQIVLHFFLECEFCKMSVVSQV